MEEVVFQQMVLALRAASGPQTPPEERHSAQAFLETFKDRDDALDYAVYLLSSPQDDILRYFGLHVIERVLRKRWKTMADADRLTLRQKVCQLLVNARPMMAEAAYIKEKVASLMADLVERDFPQRWTTFVDDLLHVAELGAAQAELALKTLACVSEDCTSAEFNSKVSTARRNDVLRGLNALMDEPILPWLYRLMAAAGQQGQPEDVQLLKAGLQLLQQLVPWVPRGKFAMPQHNFVEVFTALLPTPSMNNQALACLQALSSFQLEQAILGQVLSELPLSCWQLMQRFDGGLEALLNEDLFFAHNLAQTVAGFATQNVSLLSSFLEKPGDKPGDQGAELLKVYLDLSAYLMELPSMKVATALLPLFSAFARDPHLRGFPGFVEIIPRILAGLCERCVRTWVGEEALSAVAEEEFNDGDEASAFVHVLRSQANALAELMGKLHPKEAAGFVGLQFDTLVKCHSSVDGLKSAQSINAGLQSQVKDSEGLAVMSNPDILFWDACVGRIEHIFSGMSAEQLAMPEVELCASHALTLLFSWTPTDPQFCRARLDAFGSLRKLLKAKPPALSRALDEIFSYITFGSPGSPGSEFALNVAPHGNGDGVHLNGSAPIDVTARGREKVARCAVEVRKKADLVLIAVCEECADVCVEQLPQVCDRVHCLLQSGSLVDAQSTHLLEVCCLIARSITDASTRASFIESLLQISLGVLTSGEFEESFESPQSLWIAMGVQSQVGLQDDRKFIANRSEWYNRIFTALNDVLSVCRRVAVKPPSEVVLDRCLRQIERGAPAGGYPPSLEELTGIQPFTPLWGKVLPQVSKLLSAVQGSWRRENREQLLRHELANQVLAMPAPEAILKSSATNNIYAPRPTSRRGADASDTPPKYESGRAFYASNLWGPPEKLSALWPVWMSEMRNAAYQIIGQSFEGQAIFFIDGMFEQVMGVVFSGLEDLENRHCTTLLRHIIEPLLLSCPPPLYERFLYPTLDLVVPHFLRRVATVWRNPMAQGNGAFEADLYSLGTLSCAAQLGDEEKEILTDKIKREVTRSWLDIFLVAFGLRGPLLVVVGRSHKTKKGQPGSAKTAFVDSPAEAAKSPKRQHANLLKQLFLFGSPAVAESLVLCCIGALTFPDSLTLRRSVQILRTVIDVVHDDARYYVLIGRDAFATAAHLLIASPKHISGIEWEMLAFLRDVYLHLVIGRAPSDLGHGEAASERWKLKSDLPRQVMLRIPGLAADSVEKMERTLMANFTSRGQKEAIRVVLRDAAAANPERVEELGGPLLGRASSGTIEDLPEKLILRSRRISGGEAIDDPGNLFEGLEGP